MDETKEFLNDLGIEKDSKDNAFEIPGFDEKPEGVSEETEEEKALAEQKAKNRRERRLLDKLQAEREANIDLNARFQTLSESQKARETTEEVDYLKLVDRIYGNDTPEAREATELLKQALKGVHESARKEALEEALERFDEEQGSESKAIAEEERTVDEMMEGVEDEYGVDFETDSVSRKGFLSLLEKVSPKDKDGDIIEYADPFTVYELYASVKEKSNGRAKELASRSMVRSGSSQDSNLTHDSAERQLKEWGII